MPKVWERVMALTNKRNSQSQETEYTENPPYPLVSWSPQISHPIFEPEPKSTDPTSSSLAIDANAIVSSYRTDQMETTPIEPYVTSQSADNDPSLPTSDDRSPPSSPTTGTSIPEAEDLGADANQSEAMDAESGTPDVGSILPFRGLQSFRSSDSPRSPKAGFRRKRSSRLLTTMGKQMIDVKIAELINQLQTDLGVDDLQLSDTSDSGTSPTDIEMRDSRDEPDGSSEGVNSMNTKNVVSQRRPTSTIMRGQRTQGPKVMRRRSSETKKANVGRMARSKKDAKMNIANQPDNNNGKSGSRTAPTSPTSPVDSDNGNSGKSAPTSPTSPTTAIPLWPSLSSMSHLEDYAFMNAQTTFTDLPPLNKNDGAVRGWW